MTAKVYSLDVIAAALPGLDLLPAIEKAFEAYSSGRAIVPPVGELIFADPPGDAHIKYGTLTGDDVFVIKVATGFYDNPKQGLPGNSGVMLIFSSKTGFLKAILLDEGLLTNVRTALAGAVAARHLALTRIDRIAVLGGGLQAVMQVDALRSITACRNVAVWARNPWAAQKVAESLEAKGFAATVAQSVRAAARDSQVVVTTTAAHEPILSLNHVAPGCHITAMGSDTPDKNELAADLIGAADLFVADSIVQCATRGELHHGIKAGVRSEHAAVELGAVISGTAEGRTSDRQITIADLTGVAVQDIAIAKAVCAALGEKH